MKGDRIIPVDQSLRRSKIGNKGERRIAIPVVYTGFLGWGGEVPGGLGGTCLHWRNQKFTLFSNSQIFNRF